jgi:hypothetical protein
LNWVLRLRIQRRSGRCDSESCRSRLAEVKGAVREILDHACAEGKDESQMPGIFGHLRDRFEALWTFEWTTNECDMLTNNAAERAHRAGVIKSKIS